jgi:hypothetical protein
MQITRFILYVFTNKIWHCVERWARKGSRNAFIVIMRDLHARASLFGPISHVRFIVMRCARCAAHFLMGQKFKRVYYIFVCFDMTNVPGEATHAHI